MPLQLTEIAILPQEVRCFDTFEIAPCRWWIDVEEDIVYYDRIEESEVLPTDSKIVWAIYGHYDESVSHERGVEHLCDCASQPIAILIAKLLEDHLYCERRGL